MSLDLGTIETVAAILASGAVLLGGLYVMIGNIRAANYSKPVVEAMKGDINNLRTQNATQQGTIDTQGAQIKSLQELVTQAAKVDLLRTETQNRHNETQKEHEAITTTLERMSTNIALSTRVIVAVAKSMGVEVRKGDEGEAT